MKGILTLRKSAVMIAVYMAMLCLPGYSEPTPEQVKDRTEQLLNAVINGNIEQAKVCIKLGADVNAKVYCWREHWGENQTTDKNKINNNRNIISYTLLTYAMAHPRGEIKNIVELLIRAGADVNAKGGENGDSLLRIVVLKGYSKDLADLLIKAGADVNVKNKYGWTALMDAAFAGCKATVELLIKAGADVNIKDNNDQTALMKATQQNHENCANNYKDIAELLIKAGADVNVKSNDGWTALMWAATRGMKDVAEMLIKAGADGDATLKWAVIDRQDSSSTELLIELGADVNATDNDGLTLLTHAILYGQNDIADLLRAAGAKE